MYPPRVFLFLPQKYITFLLSVRLGKTNQETIDQSYGLINFKNGVLNLRDGRIYPHSPECGFTYVIECGADPSAYPDQNLQDFLLALVCVDSWTFRTSSWSDSKSHRPCTWSSNGLLDLWSSRDWEVYLCKLAQRNYWIYGSGNSHQTHELIHKCTIKEKIFDSNFWWWLNQSWNHWFTKENFRSRLRFLWLEIWNANFCFIC